MIRTIGVAPSGKSDAPRARLLRIVRPLPLLVPYATLAIVVAFLSKSHFTWPDEADYYKLAYNLIHLHAYSLNGVALTAFRPPGYTFFLALLFCISSNIAFLHYANFTLWLCAAFLVYRLSEILYGEFAGKVALLWALVYAVGLYTSMFLYPQTLAATLFLASLYVHLKVEEWGAGWRVVEGALFGLLILTVPMYLFALPCLALLITSETRRPFQVLSILIWIALPLGLWTTRNYFAFHRFVFIATQTGHELLVGNSPNSTPNAGVSANISTYIDEARRLKLDEVQTDKFYRRSAFQWMVHHPRQWLVLYGEKLLNWFNFRNELATKTQESNFKWTLMFITWYSLLGIAVFCIWFRTDKWRNIDLYLWSVYASGALSYAMFFTRLRYRVPYDYILIVQASACVEECWRRLGWLGGRGALRAMVDEPVKEQGAANRECWLLASAGTRDVSAARDNLTSE